MTDPRLEWRNPDGRNEVFLITSPEVTIGRKSDSDLVIFSQQVSRYHAKVVLADGGYRIIDLGSRCGTFVNSVKIDSRVLRHGDEITFGKHAVGFRYCVGEAERRAINDTTRIVQRSFEDMSRVFPSAGSDLEKMLCVLDFQYQ